MKIEHLIESAAIRDLIIMDDETGVHVCYQFDIKTVLLSFSRDFLEASTNKLIVSMLEARLEDKTYESGVYGLSPIERASTALSIGQETGYGEITAAGFQPGKKRRVWRARAGKLVTFLTKFVMCGIMLVFVDY